MAAAKRFFDETEQSIHREIGIIQGSIASYVAESFLQARDRGLTEGGYILGGVTPLKSPGMARYMKNKVAGLDVPDDVIQRMESVPKEKQREEGIRICVETIQRLRETPGVKGVHIMAIEWEDAVGEIVERAGLLPRPVSIPDRS